MKEIKNLSFPGPAAEKDGKGIQNSEFNLESILNQHEFIFAKLNKNEIYHQILFSFHGISFVLGSFTVDSTNLERVNILFTTNDDFANVDVADTPVRVTATDDEGDYHDQEVLVGMQRVSQTNSVMWASGTATNFVGGSTGKTIRFFINSSRTQKTLRTHSEHTSPTKACPKACRKHCHSI